MKHKDMLKCCEETTITNICKLFIIVKTDNEDFQKWLIKKIKHLMEAQTSEQKKLGMKKQ